MPAVVTSSGFTATAFDAFIAERREPVWLKQLRRAAWQKFVELPLPSRREEEWMRTDIRLFKLDKFSPPVGADSAVTVGAPEALLAKGIDLGGSMTVVNGRTVEARISDELAKQGVLFGSLDALVERHGDKLQPYFERKLIDPAADKFAALHAACWTGGTLLFVPRGVSVAQPLLNLAVLAGAGGANPVDLSKIMVVLEDGASATLLSETAGDDAPALHCGSIELFVGKNARLRYVSLQNWGSGTWHFAHQKGAVDGDGSLQW